MELETIVALTQVCKLEGYQACGIFVVIEVAVDSGALGFAVWREAIGEG